MKAPVNQAAVARAHMNAARVSGIRLGGDSGKKGANAFHPSLVDYWNFKGKNNADEDRNTIKGIKGNILTACNFGWALGSGYGLYKEDYSSGKYRKLISNALYFFADNFIHITEISSIDYFINTEAPYLANAYSVKVSGLPQGVNLEYVYILPDESGWEVISINKDGIYSLPQKGYGFRATKTVTDCDITIEQIPEHEGAVVTDGIDDYLKLDKVGYKIGTVIIKHVPLNLNGTWQYIFDAETQRTFAAHQTGVITTSFNNKETIDNYLVLSYNADNIKTITTPFDISKSFRNNEFLSMALYEIAIYQDILTDTEIQKEIIKMQSL